MKINNNMSALFTLNELNRNGNKLGKVAKKAASGMRINSAGDDASGYSISEKMRVQLRALSQNIENVQTGRSMMAIAEGGIQEIIENLRYIKEKAINAANDTNTDKDRSIIQKEVDQRLNQIDDIAAQTNYNGKYLLNGDYKQIKPHSQSVIVSDGNDSKIRQNTVTNLLGAFSIVGSTMIAGGGNDLGYYDPPDSYTWKELTATHSFTATDTARDAKADGKLKVDFSAATVAGGGVSYPQSFDGQGFAIGCTACESFVNIIFDANIATGESSVEFAEVWADGTDALNSYQYVIGIKDVNDAQGLAKAFYDGVTAANNNNGSGYTQNVAGEAYLGYPWGWTHNMRLSYDAADGSCYLIREVGNNYDANYGTTTNYDWLFYDKGSIVSEVMPLEGDDTAGSGAHQSPGLVIQSGQRASDNTRFFINDMHTRKLGIDDLQMTTRHKAVNAIGKIDTAIRHALDENTRIGAYQARLQETEANLVIGNENTTAAESVIRDADMAKTMMEYAKYNILQQASQSMLAQANQNPNGVLSLLQ